MTIAVDFDGVLHRYSKGWQDGAIYDPPVPGAPEALRKLKEAGHKIYIFTTRINKIYHKGQDQKQTQAIKVWMEQHDIPFDRIWNFGKPMADIYIDDRAIGFRGDWVQTLDEIQHFRVWNRPETDG